jgi:Caenorhabditis protein of unknown function, DUF268
MKNRFLSRQSYSTGFYPRVFLNTLRGLPGFVSDALRYNRMNPPSAFRIRAADLFPILGDRFSKAGFVGGHYFHQDLWAARKIYQRSPLEHMDVGSRLDGFIAHLLAFRQVTVVDIRPLESDISGLSFVQDDATELMHMATDSVESLSSLHVAEHFGLGRYGDPIDPQACFRFMASLQRVLAPSGVLYFSVPVGRERVEFNANRVFAPHTILRNFSGLCLTSFSFVGDDGCLYEDQDPLALPESELACGLFEFTKAAAGGVAFSERLAGTQ